VIAFEMKSLPVPPVGVDHSKPLVYDFYNFPKHYYEQKFESSSNPEILGKVRSALKAGSINFTEEKRGFDHGVWGELGSSSVSPVRPGLTRSHSTLTCCSDRQDRYTHHTDLITGG
jgi:hypothetical protein